MAQVLVCASWDARLVSHAPDVIRYSMVVELLSM